MYIRNYRLDKKRLTEDKANIENKWNKEAYRFGTLLFIMLFLL
jgi:hypothetical protein